MAWSAIVQAIYPSPSGNGSKDAVVIYSDGSREIRRQYNLHPEAYDTPEAVTAFIQQQVDKLNDFENRIDELVGQEIA